MRLKRKCSTLIALLLILAGCVLRFAMPGHDYLGYLLWGVAVLVFLFPRLPHVGRAVLGVLVCAGLIVFTIFEIPVVRDAHTDTDAHPDTIVVLGAGVNGSTPSLSMCNRLDAALAYLNANPAATVIVSGGQGPGEDITEAKAMADYLTAHGIDSARIVQEDRSRTTRENLENSFAILRARGGDPADGVGIVTSEYHLYRAKRRALIPPASPPRLLCRPCASITSSARPSPPRTCSWPARSTERSPMEKVNVYDWDKTIFPVDSTVAFVRWCLRRHPGVIWPLLRALALLPGYWLGKISKTAVKERMYGFLRRVPDVDAELEAFWAKNFPRVNAWYLAQQRPDDIIISASPEFLVRIPAQKLGVRLLASRVDKHTGRTDGENCHGAEKVRRLHEAYPEVQIAEFYSDSRSDSPLAELAEHAYLVHGQERTPW